MLSTESVHKTLVVAECLFARHLSTETAEADGPKIKKMLLSAVDDAVKTAGKLDAQQLSIIVSSSKEQHKTLSEANIADLVSQLSEDSKKARMQVLQDITSFEETLLSAKKFIDDWQCSELIFIVPEIEIETCKRIAHLIYNELAYTLTFTPVPIGIQTSQQQSKSSEEISSEISRLLSTMESSDGLPIKLLKSPLICDELFYHGYTTRRGGVSTCPTMRSLNLVYSPRKKDTRVYVEENRRRLAKVAGFDCDDLKMPKAVHGTDVWVVGDKQPDTFDAIVTNEPGITIAAPGADCQTLLFCDPARKVVGAAHSGWKGTIDRIQQEVVKVMVNRFHCSPKGILVSIGPSISSCCYNVYEERAKQFIDSVSESVVIRKDGVPYLDQWATTVILLQEVGIPRENIDDGKRPQNVGSNAEKVTQCTSCNPDKFFSYRRDGAIFGNQIGFIGIKKHS